MSAWTEMQCDFCGHRSARSVHRTEGGVDLCQWCAEPSLPYWLESGGHRVTFDGDRWVCSCRMNSDRWAVQATKVLKSGRVIEALPNWLRATANLHVEGRLAV